MNEPAIDRLVDNVESKYSLVIAVSKRAREIVDGSTPLVNSKSQKSVTVALEELDTEQVNYYRDG